MEQLRQLGQGRMARYNCALPDDQDVASALFPDKEYDNKRLAIPATLIADDLIQTAKSDPQLFARIWVISRGDFRLAVLVLRTAAVCRWFQGSQLWGRLMGLHLICGKAW